MKTSITYKIAFLMLIPVIGAMITLGMFYVHLTQMATDVSMINAAGHQRMLSRQLFIHAGVVRHGYEGDRAVLRETRDTFEQALRVLEGSGQTIGRDISPIPAQASAELARLSKTWARYQQAVSRLATLPVDDPQALAAFTYINENARQLADDTDQLVTALQIHNKQRQQRMLYTLGTIAAFDLLLHINLRSNRRSRAHSSVGRARR